MEYIRFVIYVFLATTVTMATVAFWLFVFTVAGYNN
jgi:hypothetical protein